MCRERCRAGWGGWIGVGEGGRRGDMRVEGRDGGGEIVVVEGLVGGCGVGGRWGGDIL